MKKPKRLDRKRKQCFIGILDWRDGKRMATPIKDTVYVGELRNGVPHGEGTLTSPDGEKYVGEFKDNKYHGQGTFTWANGDIYVGEYVVDMRFGQGTHIYANGDIYVGEYVLDERWGEGTYAFADGSIKSGLWIKDELVTTNAGEIEIKNRINHYKKSFREVLYTDCPKCFLNDAE